MRPVHLVALVVAARPAGLGDRFGRKWIGPHGHAVARPSAEI